MKIIFALILVFAFSHNIIADDLSQVSQGNLDFAISMFHELSRREGNIFFSPYSISCAIAMTYAGARNNTEREIGETMHFNLPQDEFHSSFAKLINKTNRFSENDIIQLSVANSIYPSKTFVLRDDYISLLKEYYGIAITPLDYSDAPSAAGIINSWIARNTNNRIKNMIPPDGLSPQTVLVLANAIYFLASWQIEFDPGQTREAPFYISEDNKTTADMMYLLNRFRYAELSGLQALELPYKDRDLTMIIILPSKEAGIGKISSQLSIKLLNDIETEMRKNALSGFEVAVFIPKWTMEYGITLNGPLQNMGMTEAFDLGQADFTGMFDREKAGGENIAISTVRHRAFIKVTESGTEAAAATTVEMVKTSVEPRAERKLFRADRPFIYFIRDNKTGIILFMGRMMDPS